MFYLGFFWGVSVLGCMVLGAGFWGDFGFSEFCRSVFGFLGVLRFEGLGFQFFPQNFSPKQDPHGGL